MRFEEKYMVGCPNPSSNFIGWRQSRGGQDLIISLLVVIHLSEVHISDGYETPEALRLAYNSRNFLRRRQG